MRITQKDLHNVIHRLNLVANTPLDYPEIGHYCLSCSYGGYALHQLVNEHGGVRDVFSSGHIKCRELHQMINAYILGIQQCQEN